MSSNHIQTRRNVLAIGAAAAGAWVLPARGQTRLRVVATFSILADLVVQVGGDRVEVTTLIPAGADAHSFDPRASDMRAIAAAGVFVVNGLAFEPWAERTAQAAGFRGRGVVASRGVQALPMVERRVPGTTPARTHTHSHGAYDPHAWQDVANVRLYVANIAAALAAADEPNRAFFAARADRYRATLDVLDAWVRGQFRPIPRDTRRIMMSHEAFNYFADAYELDIFAPQGISASSEPSARDVAALIAQIRAGSIRALFLESNMPGRLVTQIAAATGVRVGGTLYADSLSGPDGPASTYEAMVRHNTSTIAGELTKVG